MVPAAAASPQITMPSTRESLITCSWRVKVVSSGSVFLLDHYRMAETPRRVAKLDDSEAAVPFVDAQQRDPLQPEIAVDAAGEGVALHAVVLNRGENPGNDGLGNGGVGGSAVDDGQFGPQRDAQCDMGGIAADRPEHRPDLVVVNHLHDLVARRAPGGCVVVEFQHERFAAIPAARVGLVDRQFGAAVHRHAQRQIFVIFDGAQEADGDLAHLRRRHDGRRPTRPRCTPSSWCRVRSTAG